MSYDLLKGDVKIISNERCKKVFHSINKKNICTFDYLGSSVDEGDSGGGLVLKATKQVIGVVNAGKNPANQHPSIFASVSKYYGFIQKAMNSFEKKKRINVHKKIVIEKKLDVK